MPYSAVQKETNATGGRTILTNAPRSLNATSASARQVLTPAGVADAQRKYLSDPTIRK